MFENKKNVITALFLLASAPLSYNAVAANSIYFEPASTTVNLTDGTTTLELWADFSDPTVGGGFDLIFSGPISLDSFIPSILWSDNTFDPAFSIHGTHETTLPDGSTPLTDKDYAIAFGKFGDLAGLMDIGSVIVNLDGVGVGKIDLEINPITGGFWSSNLPTPIELPVDLISATVTSVPLPASAWFMLSGIAALGVSRRKSQA